MGDDRDGHAGRDDGVHDEGLSEHNDDADGGAADELAADGRAPRGSVPRPGTVAGGRPLPRPRRRRRDRDNGARRRLGRQVLVGRGHAGHDTVRVLLRLHRHPHTRRLAGTELRRQVHRGLRHTVHVHADPADARRGAHGTHAPDRLAFRRRTGRSNVVVGRFSARYSNRIARASSYYMTTVLGNVDNKKKKKPQRYRCSFPPRPSERLNCNVNIFHSRYFGRGTPIPVGY